jgi:hypothetical protein
MLTKPVLLALLAACGVHSSTEAPDPPAEQPVELPPEPPVEEGQYFCCDSVDLKSKSGEGCVSLAAALIDLCLDVLYCGGDWGKTGGKTQCLD